MQANLSCQSTVGLTPSETAQLAGTAARDGTRSQTTYLVGTGAPQQGCAGAGAPQMPGPTAGACAGYNLGMQRVAELQQQAWAPSTVQARSRIVSEFEAWLAGLPWERSSHTCTPMDVAVFGTTVWGLQHNGVDVQYSNSQGQQVQERITAPSSMAAMFSHLATHFNGLGRLGPWREDHPQGNPCHSFMVSKVMAGYEREAAGKGYLPSSAVPLSEEKKQQLASYLHCQANDVSLPAHQRLLAERDLVWLLYAWECIRRGAEAGFLQLSSFRDGHGSIVSSTAKPLTAGQVVYLQPAKTKTVQAGWVKQIPVTYEGDGSR